MLAHYTAARELIAEGPVEALVESLRAFCARHGGRITFRTFGVAAPHGAMPTSTRDAAVDALEEDQIVVRVDGQRGNTGRPSPAWRSCEPRY